MEAYTGLHGLLSTCIAPAEGILALVYLMFPILELQNHYAKEKSHGARTPLSEALPVVSFTHTNQATQKCSRVLDGPWAGALYLEFQVV